MTAETIPCTRCGDFIDPNAATYNSDGELVCKACDARDQINEGANRASMTAFGSATGAAALSVVSLVFDPCLLCTIGATLSALAAAKVVADANLRERMAWRVYPTVGFILLALVLGPGRFVFLVFLLAAARVAGQ